MHQLVVCRHRHPVRVEAQILVPRIVLTKTLHFAVSVHVHYTVSVLVIVFTTWHVPYSHAQWTCACSLRHLDSSSIASVCGGALSSNDEVTMLHIVHTC